MTSAPLNRADFGTADVPLRDTPTNEATVASQPWLQAVCSRFFLDWLAEQRVSLAATTYQAGKLLLIGTGEQQRPAILERNFARCMGLCVSPDGQTLWMASQYQLWRFENVFTDGQPQRGFPHDRLFVPRLAYTTGDLDVHDVAVDSAGRPVFVNTLFSCVATLSERFNFECLWHPPFISALAAEDRCHLNGLALRDGALRYVTAAGRTDVVDGWRERRHNGGCVLDVTTGATVVEGLSMPHSPRWDGTHLWFLEAGAGWLTRVDCERGQSERVAFCPGYARGLSLVGRYAVVGLSLPRHEQTFRGLPLEQELEKRGAEPRCGVLVIDLETGSTVHWMWFEGRVHELYDVVVVPGARRPGALGFANNDIRHNVWFEDAQAVRRWTAAGTDGS